MEDPNSACEPLADYPLDIQFMTVGLVHGVIKSCGGYPGFNGFTMDECYDYNDYNDEWESSPNMTEDRENPKSSLIKDGDLWLISGGSGGGNLTEVWNGEEFVRGPTMPEYMYGHCQLTINSSHIFFADCEDRLTYLLDWDTQKWTQLESMKEFRDNYCGCGLIYNDIMGQEVVVAGYGTSEIFNLNDMSWRDGPELPYGRGYASAQLANTFALVGGYEEDYLDKIYLFHQDNYEFVTKTQRLEHPRRYAGSVAVPDAMVNCTRIVK